MYTVVKYFIIFIWKYLSSKYLGTLFDYNPISNCSQYSMAFINRTKVLVGIFFPSIIRKRLLSSFKPQHPERLNKDLFRVN